VAFCTGKPKPPVHTGIGTIRESLALEVEKQEDSRKEEIFFLPRIERLLIPICQIPSGSNKNSTAKSRIRTKSSKNR